MIVFMHLIVSKEREELRRKLNELLKGCSAPITHFYPETFTINLFFQEVDTHPFLSATKRVIVHEVDQINESGREALFRYLQRPSPWVSIYLTALELTPQNKMVQLIKKNGKLHFFKEEKPWEKERRLADWLIEEAKQEGYSLSLESAITLVKGIDHELLLQELEKLICYVGDCKQITLKEIKALCPLTHHETLWQLGDTLMGKEVVHAVRIANDLLEQGVAIFPLLAHLRSQFSTGIEILQAAAEGSVAQRFSYLKGKMLDKKLQLLKKQGFKGLKRGIVLIFDTEIQAKNSSIDPSLLLELLIIKFSTESATHDALSFA